MIPIAEPSLGQEELNNVIDAVKSGWISSKGKFIPEFEEKFAHYCGVRYGIATSNGTAALHLALTTLGIEPDDEVIIPTLTFIATANAVRYTGAKPIFIDSHSDYWCIDPERIEEAITRKTKAIIPVHLYGHPCDMDTIMTIAQKHNMYVVEDAAEAHGAEYKGKKVGSFGDIACFSFYGNKIITTGEGGMCMTNDERLAERMRILRDHGMNPNRRYWHDITGFNYRMTNMQAAVGVAQVVKLDKLIERKREIAGWYKDGLTQLEEKGLIKLHPEMPWAKSVFWLYSFLIEDGFRLERGKIIKKLAENGIDSRPFFYPIHVMPPYYSGGENFPIARRISSKGINLPSSVILGRKDVERISYMINIIKELR